MVTPASISGTPACKNFGSASAPSAAVPSVATADPPVAHLSASCGESPLLIPASMSERYVSLPASADMRTLPTPLPRLWSARANAPMVCAFSSISPTTRPAAPTASSSSSVGLNAASISPAPSMNGLPDPSFTPCIE